MRRLLVALLVAISACGGAAADEGVPDINFGRDICIECGMIIDDPRFAAAYRNAEGEWQRFDDLGGLIIYGRESGELDTAEVWVSDFEAEDWLSARTAHFVPTLGVASPMGHGILAFATHERAMAFAADLDGEVIDWDVVTRLTVQEGLVGHHHTSTQDESSDGSHEGH